MTRYSFAGMVAFSLFGAWLFLNFLLACGDGGACFLMPWGAP